MVHINAIGDTCPIPVVKTKNAIRDLNGSGQVEVLVDNEIAVQNLTKMANQKGYGVSSEMLEAQKYRVNITVGEIETENSAAEETVACKADSRTNVVVAISSGEIGQGDSALGKMLMKGFIFALTQQDVLPSTILFYNSGAYLTCEETPILDDIKSLEAQGVEILTCGTCLNHYGLAEQLKVGSTTNMYVIVEKMLQAGSVVKP